MEVQLTPDLQTKLFRLARQQGRESTELIAEAVERMVPTGHAEQRWRFIRPSIR